MPISSRPRSREPVRVDVPIDSSGRRRGSTRNDDRVGARRHATMVFARLAKPAQTIDVQVGNEMRHVAMLPARSRSSSARSAARGSTSSRPSSPMPRGERDALKEQIAKNRSRRASSRARPRCSCSRAMRTTRATASIASRSPTCSSSGRAGSSASIAGSADPAARRRSCRASAPKATKATSKKIAGRDTKSKAKAEAKRQRGKTTRTATVADKTRDKAMAHDQGRIGGDVDAGSAGGPGARVARCRATPPPRLSRRHQPPPPRRRAARCGRRSPRPVAA